MSDIIVIGGGAAGCMAALTATRNGAAVTLLERNPKLGRKLYITGKGRCNLTNDCPADEVLRNIPHNSRFLTSCVTRFPPVEVKRLFESLGVRLKTERGNRVFPQSDRAADVIDALLMALRREGVEILEERAESIEISGDTVTGVRTARGDYRCGAVILATGGASYPATGSTGDGYRMAEALGHTIVPPRPSLVPLIAQPELCSRLQGLSLRNVCLRIKNGKNKTIFAERGELLFTHFGLSGPLVLSASAHMVDCDRDQLTAHIDLKPALDEQTLDARLLREFGENPNRTLHNVLETMEPRLLVPVLLDLSGLSGDIRANVVTKQQRRRLLELIKDIEIKISGTRPIAEAIITAGGVQVREVDPGSMASRRVNGLFFAGELLDVDAYTGGFNLQIAWSTGHAAGNAAAEVCGRL